MVKQAKNSKRGVEIISSYGIINMSTNCIFTIVKNSLKKRKGSNMRRNIAKVSALIMAATTAMSPMMPMATTVAMADTTTGLVTNVDDNYKIVDGTVVYDYDKIDWTTKTIPVSYVVEDTKGNKYPVTATAAAMGDAWYVPAVHGGANARAIFTLLDAAGGVIGQSREVEIPKGIEGYATDPHVFETKIKNVVNATHVTNGSYEEYDHCTICDYYVFKESGVIPATNAHVFVTKFDSFDNIKVDKDGKAVLDENGFPQADDKTKNASYDVFEACEEDGVEKENSRKKVVIPVSEGKEEWVLTAVEGSFNEYHPYYQFNGENTHFNDDCGIYSHYENGKEDGIWLNDCTKDGTYTLIHVNSVLGNGNPSDNLDLNNVLGTETITIPAHHYWGLTKVATSLEKDANGDLKPVIDEKANLVKNPDGSIKAIVDEAGNEIGAYNTHCTDPQTIVLYHVCENCDEVEAVETITIPGTGNHQLLNAVKNTDDPGYVAVDERTHQYNTHRQCAMCGEWFEDGTAKEDHEWAVKRENVVDATCGFSGSYDRVVYCKDCGYEASRQLITVAPTDKHEYGDMFVEWDGFEYIGTVTADDKNVVAVTAMAKQVCDICEGKGEKNHTGVAQSAVAELKNGDGSKDAVSGTAKTTEDAVALNGTLTVKVGTPTKTKYSCAPATVVLKAYYTGIDANGKAVKDVLVGEHEVVYYATTADYEARVQHVAGKTETITTEDGKTYKVTYCAVCGEEIAREEVKSEEPVETLGQVEGLKASVNANGQVEVSWNALENADGYLVVAINGKVRGQQIGYTAGTSFVDKDANAQDYNYYWVIAYQKNANGGIVKGQLTGYVYAMKPTAFTATAESTEDGVALAWEAVEGASKYIVKAKAASEKTATAIATVTGTEYVDAAASADEYTFYWVFPVYTNAAGKDVVGNASNYVFGMTK